MKAIKVTRPDCGNDGYILSEEESIGVKYEIEAMFDYSEVGDAIRIELIEISEEEFNQLEEFSGW